MFEVQVLIPVVSNDGRAFSAEDHAAFEAVLVDHFGGFTLYPSTAIGGWKDADGVLYTDRTRVYGIAVASLADGGNVRSVVTFAMSHYAQLAIFVRYLGLVEIMK
jgi:hypothetical protein